MGKKQVVPAKKLSKRAAEAELQGLVPRDRTPRAIREAQAERNAKLRVLAAKLYGRGLKKNQIARALMDKLSPHPLPNVRYRRAYSRISRWELQDTFRDLVYQHAVVKLDLATPGILQGISRKAKTGRVDAARLALELTGRHVPRGDSHPTQIVLQMGNVPRPLEADIELPSLEIEEPRDSDDG